MVFAGWPTWRLAASSSFLLAAVALSSSCDPGDDEVSYRATIRRTSHGIPHITANDYGSLGFGMGYAFAEDRPCMLLDQVIKVRGERARYLGPGDENEHVDSDFAYRHLRLREVAETAFGERPQPVQDMIRGYAAGFNRYIAEAGADGLPGHCNGADWVVPVDEYDLMAYYLDLGLNASSKQLIDAIGSATPPGTGDHQGIPVQRVADYRDHIGSNGWAIGADRSANGRGMLLANPHFPWEGELRLWESHLKIPGELEVYGAGLSGVPVPLIGFNEGMAWTHTVSNGQRFTFYRIEVAPGDPTSYVFDGEVREMESADYTIEVLRDGELAEESRTLYRTLHGPIVNVSPFGWDGTQTLAIRDANIDNFALVDNFFYANTSTSMDEYQQVHLDINGNPWTNTISVSKDGRAWYMDSTPTPNLSQETIDVWLEARESDFVVSALWNLAGVVGLDGSTSRDLWIEEEGARSPGLIPADRLPQIERTDYVFNANDSYWLSHAEVTLDGDYSPLHGEAGTARSPRTRMNAVILSEEDGYAGGDGKFTLEELADAAFSNRGMMAELLRGEVVARCQATPEVSVSYDSSTQMVDLTEACQVLDGWSGVLDADTVGGHVWREFIGDFDYEDLVSAGDLFAEPFDPAQPVATPAGLAPADGTDRALEALARGVLRLQEAGVPLDARLSDIQFTFKQEQRIPIHGGQEREGVTNKIDYGTFQSATSPVQDRGDVINGVTDLSELGYVINNGTSYVSVVSWEEDAPRVWSLLTYSQSDDTASPYFGDQTERFSEKAWRECLWTEEQIEADPELVTYEVSGKAQSN